MVVGTDGLQKLKHCDGIEIDLPVSMRQGFQVKEAWSFYKATLSSTADPFNCPTCVMVLDKSDKKAMVEPPTFFKEVPAASASSGRRSAARAVVPPTPGSASSTPSSE